MQHCYIILHYITYMQHSYITLHTDSLPRETKISARSSLLHKLMQNVYLNVCYAFCIYLQIACCEYNCGACSKTVRSCT